MLTEEEKKFLQYWEQNRDQQAAFSSKLLRGLPRALLFSMPIILSVVVVRLFFPDWYAKISKTSPGMLTTAVIAVLLIALFYAFFRNHVRWENHEQQYRELKSRETKTSSGQS